MDDIILPSAQEEVVALCPDDSCDQSVASCNLQCPDIARGALEPGNTTLVSDRRRALGAASIDSRTTEQKRMGVRGTAVVLQWTQLRVNVGEITYDGCKGTTGSIPN